MQLGSTITPRRYSWKLRKTSTYFQQQPRTILTHSQDCATPGIQQAGTELPIRHCTYAYTNQINRCMMACPSAAFKNHRGRSPGHPANSSGSVLRKRVPGVKESWGMLLHIKQPRDWANCKRALGASLQRSDLSDVNCKLLRIYEASANL